MRIPFYKKLYLILISTSVIFTQHVIFAADLNDVYGPLVNKDRILYTGEIDYFKLSEYGSHGSSAFGALDADPYFSSVNNAVRASVLPSTELQLGYKETFPADYGRFTYSAGGTLNTYQEYNLKYFRDLNISGRIRKEPFEIWASYIRKKQKSDWTLATLPNPTNYFVYNRNHYNKIQGGIRFISHSEAPRQKTNFSILTRPLMDRGQSNVDVSLEFEDGEVRLLTDYFSLGKLKFNYFHYLKPHFTPSFLIRYGMGKDLEAEAGVYYTIPFRYKYVYENFTRTGTSNFIVGNYRFRNKFYFPLKCRYRPNDNIQVAFSSDFSLANQRFDYWQKTTNNNITNYSSKELTYYNVCPTVKVDYLFSNDKTMKEDEFSSATKNLLRMNQFLVEAQFKKDITYLDKNQANGDQNLIDIHNLFQYPIDNFVWGTEYANFLTGNYTRYAANVADQNYHIIDTALTYGLTDNLNVGTKIGYRSSSTHKNFTLEDMNSHRYKVSPYYFFDFLCDLRLTENSLLSFSSHFVPEYTAQMWRSGDAKGFKVESEYYELSLALNILY